MTNDARGNPIDIGAAYALGAVARLDTAGGIVFVFPDGSTRRAAGSALVKVAELIASLTNPLAVDLDLGGNDVVNVGLVDGVDVSAHDHSGAGGTVAHGSLSGIGTNTHVQIDTHIAATTAHGIAGAVVGTTDSQTLSSKTLTTPTISATGFANAQHAHTGASSGGQIAHGSLTGIGSTSHDDIDDHIATTSGVHGAAGALLGEIDGDAAYRSRRATEVSDVEEFLTWANGFAGAGTGSGVSIDPWYATSAHPGVIDVNTGGGTDTGDYVYYRPLAYKLGGGALTMLWHIYLQGATGSTYTMRIGLSDTTSGTADPTNGVYLEIDRSASANWRYKTAAAGTRTTTTSGTAVASDTWITVGIAVNAGGTSVSFTFNGASLGAAITTNIPTATLAPFAQVQKGPAWASVALDRMETHQTGLSR